MKFQCCFLFSFQHLCFWNLQFRYKSPTNWLRDSLDHSLERKFHRTTNSVAIILSFRARSNLVSNWTVRSSDREIWRKEEVMKSFLGQTETVVISFKWAFFFKTSDERAKQSILLKIWLVRAALFLLFAYTLLYIYSVQQLEVNLSNGWIRRKWLGTCASCRVQWVL